MIISRRYATFLLRVFVYLQEDSITPELLWIDDLEKSVQNKGMLTISPKDYHDRDNGQEMRAFDMGMIKINLTNPIQEVGMTNSPAIWSRPMPLGQYIDDFYLGVYSNNINEKN